MTQEFFDLAFWVYILFTLLVGIIGLILRASTYYLPKLRAWAQKFN